LHSNLRIAKVIWSKSVINEEKELSSLIVKIHNVEQINRLIKDDFLHEYFQISCELFVNNCRIKQCFNCQRYDHIHKIYRHKRRCSICVESHNDSTCKILVDKRKCVNCENNHSIWSFQCKVRIAEKDKISNIWRTKSILHSIDFKNIQQTIFNEFDVDAQQTFSDEKITSSTSSFCSSIKEILTQKKTTILKSMLHLKTKNYSMNEIIDKRTLSQNLERSMSSSSCQQSVSVMQMFSSQTNNAFDVLRNRLNTRTSQKTTQSTQTQTSI
jgi:hypothetical protein